MLLNKIVQGFKLYYIKYIVELNWQDYKDKY